MLTAISSSLSSLFSAGSGTVTQPQSPLYDRVYNAYATVIQKSVSPFLQKYAPPNISVSVETLLLEPCSALAAAFTFLAGWKEPFDFYNMNPTTLSEEQMSKSAILLIHGNGGNQSSWLSLGKALQTSGLGAVYTVNLPAGPVTDADWEIIGRKIDQIRAQHLRKIHLVGHSRGGVVAIQAFAKWPNYIEKIVSIGMPVHSYPQLSNESAEDLTYEITGKYDRRILRKSSLENRKDVNAGHVGLLYCSETHKHVINWLRKAPEKNSCNTQ